MTKILMKPIPLFNLRMEIANYMGLFNEESFLAQFTKTRKMNEPINTVYESWYGRSELLLSQILRKSILNVESAVCSCVYFESAFKKIQTQQILDATNNPFILRGKSTANNFYDRLPGLINDSYKLSKCDENLWIRTKDFYKDIRNPLFHGKELSSNNPIIVKELLEFLLELFNWLDSWFDLNQIIENASSLSEVPEFDSFISQIVIPDYTPKSRPSKRDDMVDVPGIDDTLGISIQEYVHITLQTNDERFVTLDLSPKATMKLLGYLTLVPKHTGWRLPETLANEHFII